MKDKILELQKIIENSEHQIGLTLINEIVNDMDDVHMGMSELEYHKDKFKKILFE